MPTRTTAISRRPRICTQNCSQEPGCAADSRATRGQLHPRRPKGKGGRPSWRKSSSANRWRMRSTTILVRSTGNWARTKRPSPTTNSRWSSEPEPAGKLRADHRPAIGFQAGRRGVEDAGHMEGKVPDGFSRALFHGPNPDGPKAVHRRGGVLRRRRSPGPGIGPDVKLSSKFYFSYGAA